ncbi:MAG: cation diffusion facilitator family transporter [Betaproteobacteria bacterium]|nr:cation diffusion facilitator family transporter [Betaproteobacteria bacterium]
MMQPPPLLERYAWLSIAAALATIALKSWAWWLTGSVGLLSDAMESVVNLAAGGLALWMLRLSVKPPDVQHPFGHSKAEYLAAGIEGALIALASAAIILSAAPRLFAPRALDTPGLGLAISAIATVINLAVAILLIRAGKAHHSITLEADGRHLLTDVWTSLGVIAGVALVALSGWLILDPIVALVVAMQILWTGASLIRRSIAGLLDAAIPDEERADIERICAEYTRRYGIAFHAVRTRHAGRRRFISFHLLVPNTWTVEQAHQLSEEIESRIRSLVPNASLFSHIEPISHPSSYDDVGLDR